MAPAPEAEAAETAVEEPEDGFYDASSGGEEQDEDQAAAAAVAALATAPVATGGAGGGQEQEGSPPPPPDAYSSHRAVFHCNRAACLQQLGRDDEVLAAPSRRRLLDCSGL